MRPVDANFLLKEAVCHQSRPCLDTITPPQIVGQYQNHRGKSSAAEQRPRRCHMMIWTQSSILCDSFHAGLYNEMNSTE